MPSLTVAPVHVPNYNSKVQSDTTRYSIQQGGTFFAAKRPGGSIRFRKVMGIIFYSANDKLHLT